MSKTEADCMMRISPSIEISATGDAGKVKGLYYEEN